MFETLSPPVLTVLTEADQLWLASFGVDPTWQDDETFWSGLNDVIAYGSRRLDEHDNQGDWQAIVVAREQFMEFVGVAPAKLEAFRENNPTIIPLDTFIHTQRIIGELGLDAVKIINTLPAAIGLAPESVRDKVANLTALGLDAVKIINTLPATIGYAPESVRDKVANLTALGLDAVKIINTLPAAIGLAPESVRDKVANLTALGLDAVKIINTLPATIGYAPESVRDKVANLTALGLDAVKIINTLPAAIGLAPESVRDKVANLTALGLDAVKIINTLPAAISYAPESVRYKVRFLERSARLLHWDYGAQELINTHPAVLGFNTQKLAILRHIAARNLNEQSRSTEPGRVGDALIVPLEKYILELAIHEHVNNTEPAKPDLTTLARVARSSKLNAHERREQALETAATTNQTLGRLGAMYLAYRNQ